jgi:hypothetical protein
MIVDFIKHWSVRAELSPLRLVAWLGLGRSKYYQWRDRYGQANEHNAPVPRDHWLEEWEKAAIVEFARQYPLEGYRRLTFMMLDADVVAVSASSVYRVLSKAGLLSKWNRGTSRKGKGFDQPTKAHEHWHVDITYLNLAGTFYYLCSVLDGYSRYLVHWELAAAMKERDVELVLQRAREKYPRLAVNTGLIERPAALLISHVLTELTPEQVRVLADFAAQATTTIWVEPGTYDASMTLVAIRERLRDRLHVVAPCTHQARCGLLAPENARHWCHHFAAPPPAVFTDSDWGKFALWEGIDLRSLPLSFLVLDRRPGPPPAMPAAINPGPHSEAAGRPGSREEHPISRTLGG